MFTYVAKTEFEIEIVNLKKKSFIFWSGEQLEVKILDV